VLIEDLAAWNFDNPLDIDVVPDSMWHDRSRAGAPHRPAQDWLLVGPIIIRCHYPSAWGRCERGEREIQYTIHLNTVNRDILVIFQANANGGERVGR